MSDLKCACSDCDCAVAEGQQFCSDSCANGHQDGSGCGHDHCGCAGK